MNLLSRLRALHPLLALRAQIKRLPPPLPRTILTLSALVPWLPALILFKDHVAQLMFINGESMSPLLCPDWSETHRKDVVLSRMWEPAKGLRRGEVVALWSPKVPDRVAVKRVIALEGDTVYTRKPYPFKTAYVPVGHVWVEGEDPDPRHNIDSHTYGPVSKGLIMGKITHILWPRGRIGRIGLENWKGKTKVIEATDGELDSMYRELNGG